MARASGLGRVSERLLKAMGEVWAHPHAGWELGAGSAHRHAGWELGVGWADPDAAPGLGEPDLGKMALTVRTNEEAEESSVGVPGEWEQA